ncbi:hypothetical protein P872_21230 [Rhodonellum psychrophilum GCM71 = DSM 17998]|uniref:Uncharacterized protein n=1 Tax=Rhodonellum psychrophilum GCM71 = DSM 17998 TaxID=1123057 RepID=U5BVW6_9BACT|nr:hypothetical protein P872_21230 [Rhodonellum psychrophilum GCM71 = DSM 17998]
MNSKADIWAYEKMNNTLFSEPSILSRNMHSFSNSD